MNIDKTFYFTVDGKAVNVSDLPVAIRKQIEIYDAFREECAKDSIKFEMSSMALNVKTLQVQEIIRKWLNPETDKQTDSAPAVSEEVKGTNG